MDMNKNKRAKQTKTLNKEFCFGVCVGIIIIIISIILAFINNWKPIHF